MLVRFGKKEYFGRTNKAILDRIFTINYPTDRQIGAETDKMKALY